MKSQFNGFFLSAACAGFHAVTLGKKHGDCKKPQRLQK
ncbi:hypothetical protein C4J84_0321 [Pseudomonas sp. R11-23-07]|nr:hypothetical protein C4J84_0321 [Pseudomonas sp. R11-23-07]